MVRFLFAVFLMLTALIQSTFLPALGFIGVIPDFTLVLLLIWSATHGVYEGMVWAFGLGIWIDLLTLDTLGTHGLALLAVAIIGGLIGHRLFRSGALLPIGTVFVATLAFHVVALLITLASGRSVDSVAVIRLALLASFLNALLVPIAYFLLLVIDRWMPRHV